MVTKPVRNMVIQDGGDQYVIHSPLDDLIEIYNPNKAYTYDNYVYYSADNQVDGKMYRSIYDMGNSPDGAFNLDHWVEVPSLSEELGYVRSVLYQPIAFSSFSMSPNVALMGNTITSLQFSYGLNKDPIELKLNGSVITYDPDTHKHNQNGNWTKDSASSVRTFKMQAKDERNAEASTSNAVLNFYNYIYWGVSTVPSNINSAFINSLSSTTTGNKTVSNTKVRTLKDINGGIVNSGIHIWYAIPSRLGTCKFTVGGFTGGFSNSSLVDVTNDATSPYTEQYRVYWSDNDGLGVKTIVIE